MSHSGTHPNCDVKYSLALVPAADVPNVAYITEVGLDNDHFMVCEKGGTFCRVTQIGDLDFSLTSPMVVRCYRHSVHTYYVVLALRSDHVMDNISRKPT